jgi:hypothetical protein
MGGMSGDQQGQKLKLPNYFLKPTIVIAYQLRHIYAGERYVRLQCQILLL